MRRLEIIKLQLARTFNVHAVLALGGVVGALLVWYISSPFGIGLSSDSVGYIAVARNIAVGLGVVSYDLFPFVQQPPLYPALLALLQTITGLDPLVSARIPNALLLGGIILLAGLVLQEYTQNHFVAVFGALVVLVSPVLIRVSVMAWSETLFVFLVLLFLWIARAYLETQTILNWNLIWLALLAALACMTRYIGVSLVCVGLLVILLQTSASRTRKLAALVLFAALGVLPLALWLFRNYAVSQTLMGERVASDKSLFENVALTCNTIAAWYLPEPFRAMLWILIPVILAGVYILAARRQDIRLPEAKQIKARVPLVGFIVFYLLLLLITATATEFDDIGTRLLAPLFVPLTILLLALIAKLLGWFEQKPYRRAATLLLAAGLGLWLLLPLGETSRLAANALNQGIGFTKNAWQASPLIKYMLAYPLDTHVVVYSNAPDAVYIFTNRNARMSPALFGEHALRYRKTLSPGAPPWSMPNGAYLVWSNRTTRDYLYTPTALSALLELEPIVQLSDGAIYRVGSTKN